MNNVKAVRGIVQRLNPKEIKNLTKYLSYNSADNNQSKKSIHLLIDLRSDKNYSSSELQHRIYGVQNYFAFNKLIKRLRDKVLEVVTFDECLNSDSYSKRNQVLLNLRKKQLQADILQLKGLRNDLLPIYQSIIKKSRKYELYEEELQALSSMQRLISITVKSKNYKRINQEIVFAEKCKLSLRSALNIYLEIGNLISHSENFASYSKDLEDAIEKLNSYYLETKSSIIGFYLFTLLAEQSQGRKKYNEANSFLTKIKSILESNDSAYTHNRYGTILLNISNNSIYQENYRDAIEVGREAKKYFENIPYSLSLVEENIFYASYYLNDLYSCDKILKSLRSFASNTDSRHKYDYYFACLQFRLRNFERVIELIKDNPDFDKDRDGWNINRRILLILAKIELSDFESAEQLLNSFQKYIKRAIKNKLMRPRYFIIIKILLKLVTENYDFDKVFMKRRKKFELLSSSDDNFSLQLKSPELINFNEWFIGKLKVNKK